MHQVIEKGTGFKHYEMFPWWSDECKNASQARIKAFIKVKASFSFNDLVECKKAQAVGRRVIRKAE